MLDEEQEKRVIQDVVLLKLCGFKPIIVHGGGKEISKWVDKVGKETKFVNGLRVTDEETMEIAEMVLSKVNKKLVQLVEELGIKSIGVSGIDGGLLKVTKKYVDGEVSATWSRRFSLIFWKKTFFRLSALLVWITISRHIMSMRTRRPVRLPRRSRQKSWLS